MIKMQIIGNLGRDAEVYSHNGEVVVNFSVAHTDKYKDGNGNVVQKATWVSCSWWTEKQSILPFLKKGQMVYVEGVPEAKLWKDKNKGEQKAFLNMRVLGLQLVGGGRPGDNNYSAAVPQQEKSNDQVGYVPMQNDSNNPDDLPF
jgi:single-strand DNA-binding protein